MSDDVLQAWELALYGAGVIAEFFGLWITVLEIGDRIRLVDRTLNGGRQLRLTAHDSAGLTDNAVATGGAPPTLEERVTALEKALAAVPEQIRAAERRAEAHAEATLRAGLGVC